MQDDASAGKTYNIERYAAKLAKGHHYRALPLPHLHLDRELELELIDKFEKHQAQVGVNELSRKSWPTPSRLSPFNSFLAQNSPCTSKIRIFQRRLIAE
jgi:hypothetical protein